MKTINLDKVLEILRTEGKPNTIKIYNRHGVTGDSYGVSYATLTALTKKIKVNHQLARQLWQTDNHDARVLATKIADPNEITRAEIERWVSDCNNYIITDAVSSIAAQMPNADTFAHKWITSNSEWITSIGWNVLAILATIDSLTITAMRELLPRITTEIATAPNRTKHAMNNTLIAIGGVHVDLRNEALDAASSIGKVQVDHGQTSCKTPDAAQYIKRMASQRAAKKRPSKVKL